MKKEIPRSKVADIFYHNSKLNKLYGGKAPSSLQMSDVRKRLETHTIDGKRRKK